MARRRSHFKSLVVALVLIIGALVLQYSPIAQQSPTTESPSPGFYRIDHFVDGDTIAVQMNGKTEEVRFIGIDTPETHKPNTPVQCFGPEASNYTKQTIGSHPVRLVADPLDDNRDRYGRLLRYVYLPDGTLLNEMLIQKGYAFAYLSFPFSKKEAFAADATEAQSQHIGLWANCQPTYQSGRWQSNVL